MYNCEENNIFDANIYMCKKLCRKIWYEGIYIFVTNNIINLYIWKLIISDIICKKIVSSYLFNSLCKI